MANYFGLGYRQPKPKTVSDNTYGQGATYGPERQYGPAKPENFNYSQINAPKTASTVNTVAPAFTMARTTQPTITASPTGRRLGPSEFANLRTQYGASESNFDKYFERDASGNIYAKATGASAPATQAAPTASVAPAAALAPQAARPVAQGANRLADSDFLRRTAEKKLTELQKNYTSTLAPSAQEQAAQQQLTDLMGSAQLGISGLEGQGRGIPLSLVRGQQGKLQEQANIKAQTLQNEIANYQAARQAQGNVYSAELDFEAKRLDRETQALQKEEQTQISMLNAGYQPIDPSAVTDPNSVVQIGGQTFLKPSPEAKVFEMGDSLIEYTPGQEPRVLYTRPVSASDEGFTLSPGQTRFASDGTPIAHASEVFDSAYNAETGTYTVKPADAQKINQQIAASDSYKAITTASNLESSVDNLETLIDGLQGSGNRFFGKEAGELTSAYNTLILQAKEFFNLGVLNGPDEAILKSIVPSPNSINLRGGTRAGLEQLRSMIGDHLKARYEDLSTQYTGYDANQITNLQNIERKYSENLYGNMLRNGEITEEEYNDLIDEAGSFSNDLSTSQNGSASSIAAAIKQVESGGNYNARGGSGEGGAYQFMPATWKSWAGKYLGNANAPMSQENQDKVATARIQDWLNEGKTPAEIALLWNSGKTTPVKGVNRYGVAYDSGAYRDKVLGVLNG